MNIIFGSGIVSEILYKACKEQGIKIDCFCDNNINKTKVTLFGLPILYTPDLKGDYKFFISNADIKDAVEQLKGLGYTDWTPCSSILRDFDIYQYEFSKPIDLVAHAVSTTMLCHDSYMTPDKLFLRSVDIIVTERCSLHCKDCSNLMRYYECPKDTDLKELKTDIDKLCSIVDEINEVRVLGGEPLIYKEIHLVVKKLIDEPKIRKIVIYTNGTILPSDEQLEVLKNDKVLFIITDYGKLSGNLDNLTKKLSKDSIAFYVQEVGHWTDCSKISKHKRSDNENKKLFNNCCVKNILTLSNGKLFRCPYSANADRLNAVSFKDDSVNIYDDDIKDKIRDYILDKDFLKTCDYCNGRSFGDKEIEPAIQQLEVNKINV